MSSVETTTGAPRGTQTDRVRFRGTQLTAPRWVPMLMGLFVAAVMLAVESHGVVSVVTGLVAAAMLVVLGTIGRRQVAPPPGGARDAPPTR